VNTTAVVFEDEVSFTTYADQAARVDAALRGDELSVDWGKVSAVDSSAIALIFHTARLAHARGVRVHHHNLPAAIDALAELYGVADLLREA